jgi:type 1 glutamine amidotransferase
MPVAYTKQFGEGRVFYHAGGHELEEMERPEVTTMVRRGMEWATR